VTTGSASLSPPPRLPSTTQPIPIQAQQGCRGSATSPMGTVLPAQGHALGMQSGVSAARWHGPGGLTHQGKSSPGGPGITLLPPRVGGRAAAVGAARPGLGVAAAGVAAGQRWGTQVPPAVAAGVGVQGTPVGVGEAPQVFQLPRPPQRLVAGGLLPTALGVGAGRARVAGRWGAVGLLHREAAGVAAIRARGLEGTRITPRGLAMPGLRGPAALLEEPSAVSEGQQDGLIAAWRRGAGGRRPLAVALQLAGAGRELRLQLALRGPAPAAPTRRHSPLGGRGHCGDGQRVRGGDTPVPRAAGVPDVLARRWAETLGRGAGCLCRHAGLRGLVCLLYWLLTRRWGTGTPALLQLGLAPLDLIAQAGGEAVAAAAHLGRAVWGTPSPPAPRPALFLCWPLSTARQAGPPSILPAGSLRLGTAVAG